MLLSQRELTVWTGFGPFEIALHSFGFLIFTCLATLQLEGVISSSWHAIFSPLYVALGLHVYYLIIVSTRMGTWCVQCSRKSKGAVAIITSFSFFGVGLLLYVEYITATYLDGVAGSSNLIIAHTLFMGYLFFRLLLVYRGLITPTPQI